jgi:hypothetical protein
MGPAAMTAQLSLSLDTPALKPQTRALLEELRKGPVSSLDCLRVVGSYRASARVMELRQAGYLIRTERKAGQTAVYFLEGRT